MDKIEGSSWYNDSSYDSSHVLKYQVLSLFGTLKEKRFDTKYDNTNYKEQDKKIVY